MAFLYHNIAKISLAQDSISIESVLKDITEHVRM